MNPEMIQAGHLVVKLREQGMLNASEARNAIAHLFPWMFSTPTTTKSPTGTVVIQEITSA